MGIKFLTKMAFLLLSLFCLLLQVSAKTTFSCQYEASPSRKIVKTPESGGIKEVIPTEFQIRYMAWKDELLSTEFGRNLWAKYATKTDFTLVIEVEDKNKKGAGTGDYVWDENGLLVSATILLGGKLDKGFPDPIYYPVMNSISEFNDRKEISGVTLAATKFAHEFGHINLTIQSNQDTVKLENKLMPVYNSIFLKNGYNIYDQRLVDLAGQMGGTPTQIWENREYWGETSAMNYILEKTSKKDFHCSLLNKINENVHAYAKGYEGRFSKVSDLKLLEGCKR